ncbi:MAG: nuclear transport factor 2 family protein [Cyanobacteria bacterium P01_G01_bin.67]
MTNIEIIRELYRTFKDKDYEAFRQLCDRDLIWIQNQGFPHGSTTHGANEVIDNVFKRFDSDWQSWSFEIEEYLDAGTSVIVVGLYQGVHRVSEKSFHSSAVHIYDLVRGKVTRFRQFADTKVIWDVIP